MHAAAAFDISPALATLGSVALRADVLRKPGEATRTRAIGHLESVGDSVEQRTQGPRPAAAIVGSFDGMGAGFTGPQGAPTLRNPSDNSLAVGPDHIVQINGSRLAVYTKKGALYDTTGVALLGTAGVNTVFAGFGGRCDPRPNGDSVVRYDQLAGRWLVVMPIFRRDSTDAKEPYSMCYAVSVGPDPMGPYYRYEFRRSLFPDYPRPAVWPDGYYVPTSTGDDVIQKHACVADRARMLGGQPATEQCVIIDGVNFLNNADIDGQALPPLGAPNIMMAAGGTQLEKDFEDDGIYVWKFHVDWNRPAYTSVSGPAKVRVAPYHYLCDGQLTRCVPQPGTDRRLDAQGDKIMQRLVYRNVNGHESIVAVHSVNTAAGGGGVRWYEFRLDEKRDVHLVQQSTFAPDSFYRWLASPAMDRQGNIGIGYSFGGTPNFAGQRFAGRLAGDPLGTLSLRETVLATGEASQTNTLRWEDYAQTAIDPSDDCTIWYVGDYYRAGAPGYSTRIAAVRMPDCLRGTVSGASYFDTDHDGYRDPGEPGLPGREVSLAGGQQTRLVTDSSGRYSTWLPADPAYAAPTYTIAARASTGTAWVDTPVHSTRRRAVTANGRAYTVQMVDRDDVTGLDFGSVCTVPNAGGAGPAFWNSPAGRAAVASRFPAFRMLVDSTLYLMNADGSRFRVPDTLAVAYDQFRMWLRGSAAAQNTSYRAAAQVASVALNVAFGKQDGTATVEDPVAGDWPTISTLVTRVSTFVSSHTDTSAPGADRSTAEVYEGLLGRLNNNTTKVTPSIPASCPAPVPG
ncbi:MAG: hypothetical protein EXR93_07285 [Gemmatimonadetes bacterium]|nr:hypothetical protein [Gemmatimonadota bacterium]